MTQNDTHHILSLLAATIFADKRVFSTEITAFAQGAASLDVLRNNHPKLSEAKLLVWYEVNKEHIKEKMTTPYFQDWFYDLLDKVSETKDKGSVLSVIKKISKADGEIHVSEKALYTLAARYWDIELPS